MLRFANNLGNILAELPDKLLKFASALPGGLSGGSVVLLVWAVTIPYSIVKSIFGQILSYLPSKASEPLYSLGNRAAETATRLAAPVAPYVQKADTISANRQHRIWAVNLLALAIVAGIIAYFANPASDIIRNADFDLLEEPINAQLDAGFLTIPPTDAIWLALLKATVNTLVLVIISIFVASLLGLLVGIARLAKHPIISRFALGYVELFRNIPLLGLMLLLSAAVLLQALPRITESWSIPRVFYFSNRGAALPSIAAGDGLWWIWVIFLVIGIVAALYLRRHLSRIEELTGRIRRPNLYGFGLFMGVAIVSYLGLSLIFSLTANPPTATGSISEQRNAIIITLDANKDHVKMAEPPAEGATIPEGEEFIATRNITFNINALPVTQTVATIFNGDSSASLPLAAPDIAALAEINPDTLPITVEADLSSFVPPTSLSLPDLIPSPPRYDGGFILSVPFFAALLGLIFYFSAFIAEIVRGSIQSIHPGQTEAANALGLSAYQRLTLVILPQAFTIMIPSLNNEYQNVNKDSAVAFAIGYIEILFVLRQVANERGELVTLLIGGLFIFLFVNLIISTIMNTLNRLNRVAR